MRSGEPDRGRRARSAVVSGQHRAGQTPAALRQALTSLTATTTERFGPLFLLLRAAFALLFVLSSGCVGATAALDNDGDGFSPNEGDCDDTNPERHPGASDRCDGMDRNCDGLPGCTLQQVSAGGNHSCGIGTEGTALCWGGNEDGQADAPDLQLTAISAGDRYNLALDSQGYVIEWGFHNSGHSAPPLSPPIAAIAAIAAIAGYAHRTM